MNRFSKTKRQGDANMLKRALLGGSAILVLLAAAVLSAETQTTPLIDKVKAGDLTSVRKIASKANIDRKSVV